MDATSNEGVCPNSDPAARDNPMLKARHAAPETAFWLTISLFSRYSEDYANAQFLVPASAEDGDGPILGVRGVLQNGALGKRIRASSLVSTSCTLDPARMASAAATPAACPRIIYCGSMRSDP